MPGEILCTARDFSKAREMILRYLQENGVASRRMLSNFRVWGVTYEAIELAIRDLRVRGIVEELYTLPSNDPHRSGQRKEYWGLVTALDTRAVELPPGVIREKAALQRIADYEEVAV